ncbi:traB domain-containing protein isoform X2 [Tursiops truncatus]|uniref:traB domain-containing protein isoform X2 n=1 Tax=Tursiops truncatus TaxID=9739 RepID=UPI003CCF69AB
MEGQDEQPLREASTEPIVTSGGSEVVPRVLPGEPQNLSDVDAFHLLLEMKLKRRQERPNLPRTVTELVAEDGSRVYVVGTAHFSDDSKKDVAKTIREVQPDVVVVELCQYRVSMLKMDERTLLREAKEISLEKLQQAVRQNGVMSGLMQMLLLKVSAHITEQLGMAPGGEFREAFKEVGPGPAGGRRGLGAWELSGARGSPANTQPLPRPARCLSASSTWATGLSPSPSRGPSPPSLSGRRSSWPGACVSCRTLSGRAPRPPGPGMVTSGLRYPQSTWSTPGLAQTATRHTPLILGRSLLSKGLPSPSSCQDPRQKVRGPRPGSAVPRAGSTPFSPSKDDVERCKQKDLLEQMMAEMIGEFPDLHRTIVSERDIYLTYMLRQAARRLELPRASDAEPRKCVPSVVVGVVGMGHVPGIEKNWTTDLNIQEIMTVPPPSVCGRVSWLAAKAAFLGLLGYGLYWMGRRASSLVLSLPAAQYCLQRASEAWPHK